MSDGRYKPKAQWILAAAIAALGTLAVTVGAFYPWNLGARQPISFSHRVHAGKKEIGCVMCHPGVLRTPEADLPPVQTCMPCHSRIAIHYPEIEKVRQHYEQSQPIRWVRITNLPDLAHFDHSMHIASGVDCGKCHGDVKAMDRIVLSPKFTMGFCIECHWQNNATHDCFACHY